MSRLCADAEICYERIMKLMSVKFFAALLSMIVMAMPARGGETNTEKAKDAVKNAANKTGEVVKDTTHKAIESGKAGAQKAGVWATNVATNVAAKATKLGTNVAAKAKVGAQKVENEATNIIGEIKEKVSH
jgi:hypothetical protein